jgi:outer membrane protein TolC
MARTKRALREIEPDSVTGDRPSAAITEEEIAQRAYALYEARGREDGHDLDDWLQAERELVDERSR